MNKLPNVLCTVDFETAAIQPHPQYPPAPCGVAIRWEDGRAEYLSWGHADNGKTFVSFEEARRAVARAFEHPCLFHNAAFDLEVARVHMGLPYPKEWHDTLYMAFLCYPHAISLSLKPLAEQVLGLKPEEKDALVEWAHTNLGVPRSKAMEHVPKIPADVVGPYAVGDVNRTYRLARRLSERITDLDMWGAYQRERSLMPHLLDAERRGVRVDRQRLYDNKQQLQYNLGVCDARLNLYFGNGDTNWDANEEVADRLEGFGYTLPLTDTGKRSTALPVLRKLLPAPLFNLIAYRNKSATMLRTFIDPWLEFSANDGRLHTGWSPVRNPDGNGTRTGRIASVRPNLANIPNEQKVEPPEGLLPLPLMREALLPEEGHLWLSADYSQQELRLLAHYEDGDLMRAYQANARLDLHAYAARLVKERTGIDMDRKTAKILGFSIIYGAGAWKIAEQLGVPPDEAGVFREAYLDALPGVRGLQKETKQRFGTKRPIRTIGGRSYFCEPPKGGRSFEYKALNVLIQGSAADQTKEAIIDFCAANGHAYLLTTVYDEINVSVPADEVGYYGGRLEEAMDAAVELSVPVSCDLEYGPNWAQLKPLEKSQ